MTLLRHVAPFVSHLPLVRPALRRAYRAGYHVLERTRLTKPNMLPAVRVSPPEMRAFFGYYDKSPWDSTGRYLLFLSSTFDDRMPSAKDAAQICLIDLSSPNDVRIIGETRAWCWQQGAMLQWLGSTQQIVFNDIVNNEYVSRIIDLDGNQVRVLPRPIYALSKGGTQAVSLDFERIHFARPGYGYVSRPIFRQSDPTPPDAGIWWLDMETGVCKLILTIEQLAESGIPPTSDNAFHYVLHAEFNPRGTRFVFLHRWFCLRDSARNRPHTTRMYCANPDGRDLCLLEDSGFTSHFTWMDDECVLATSKHADLGFNYHVYRDRSDDVSILGQGILTGDGHPSFSPDRRWLLTDTYPDRVDRRAIVLYDMLESRRVDLGRYRVPPRFSGMLRCDLHPRWNHDGASVCFDSVHEGFRAVYTVNVSSITEDVT